MTVSLHSKKMLRTNNFMACLDRIHGYDCQAQIEPLCPTLHIGPFNVHKIFSDHLIKLINCLTETCEN